MARRGSPSVLLRLRRAVLGRRPGLRSHHGGEFALLGVVAPRLLDRGLQEHRGVEALHRGLGGGRLVRGGGERAEVWDLVENLLRGSARRMVGRGSLDAVDEHGVLCCAGCREAGRVGRRSGAVAGGDGAAGEVRVIGLGAR